MGFVVVMDSVVTVPDSGVGVMDCKVENLGAIKRAESETAAADGIALRRPRSGYQTSAVAIF